MKKTLKLIALLLAIALTAGAFAGCQQGQETTTSSSDELPEWVDYLSQCKLDLSGTDTIKLVLNNDTGKKDDDGNPIYGAAIYNFVDGDTTHFNVSKDVVESGVMKVRYVAINTPESTGSIEPWGKTASNYTKAALSSASSIVIESTTSTWELDSSGSRYMGWVWYLPAGETEYRNLNLELVQVGLSLACGATTDKYYKLTSDAWIQAQAYKLYVHSDEADPDYYDGDAIPVTVKDLRTNPELYLNKKVVFQAVIIRNNSQTCYVEEYNEEDDLYYGVNVYYGFSNSAAMKVLSVGNMVQFVGSFQYYEAGGTYQVTDIKYSAMNSGNSDYIFLVSSGHETANRLTTPELFYSKVTVNIATEIGGEETTAQEFDYAELALSTSIAMNGLYVKSIYTTANGGDSDGAMTLTCEVDGQIVYVRTTVLRDSDKNKITEEAYLGKTIDVVGIVDYYDGQYQIKVFSANSITVHEE